MLNPMKCQLSIFDINDRIEREEKIKKYGNEKVAK